MVGVGAGCGFGFLCPCLVCVPRLWAGVLIPSPYTCWRGGRMESLSISITRVCFVYPMYVLQATNAV